MKIVDVCAFYTPHGGGVRTYIERKFAIGAALGHEIVVIVPGREGRVEVRADSGRMIHIASPAFPLDRRYRYFASAEPVHALLDNEQPDVVEASSPWRTASIVADWRGDAVRSLIMHADPLTAYAYRWFGAFLPREVIDRQFQWFWKHLRRATASFDMVISANRQLSTRLSSGGVPNVRTIALGIEGGFSPAHRDETLRRELLIRCGLDAEASLFIGIGRHAPEKRWPMVMDACRMAGMAHPIGLVLIGDGRDRIKIARYATQNPHVHLLAPIGDRTTLARIMASADALIHGCEAETYGLAAAEAVASGLPVVVPDGGGAADLAEVGCSEKYAAGNAVSAAMAIDRLLSRDPAQRREAALHAASEARSMASHFEELLTAYALAQNPTRIAA